MILGIVLEPGNDRNGNPRRVVIGIDGANGKIVGAVQDDYTGVESILRDMAHGKRHDIIMRVDSTPSECKRILSRYGK